MPDFIRDTAMLPVKATAATTETLEWKAHTVTIPVTAADRRLLERVATIRPLREVVRDMVEAALAEYGGPTVECAAALGICRKTLYSKVHAYGLGKRFLFTKGQA